MSEIKLNQEVITVLQNCKDAKSVMALAKSKGVELSVEQAEKLFVALQNDKLTDNELEKVTGGQCECNGYSAGGSCPYKECLQF